MTPQLPEGLVGDGGLPVTRDYSPAPIELTVSAELAGLRLDQALARLLPQYSRNRIADWVREQRVRVAGATAKPKQKVWGGEQVRVEPQANPVALAYAPEPLAVAVVHEDAELIVIDKPAGFVVHPGSGNWSGTLLNALLHHCPQLAQIPRAGIVHRLDKDTSGLLVVAKTLTAHTQLVRQLQARTMGRTYWAFIVGDVDKAGEIYAPIGRHPAHRTRMAVVASGRSARTRYRPQERFGDVTLVECRLDTGRTHQIRVHLASIGHPLLGDPVYGQRRKVSLSGFESMKRQALHAHQLDVEHPASGQRLTWKSPLPADLHALLRALRMRERR